jgi:hypothetical protein
MHDALSQVFAFIEIKLALRTKADFTRQALTRCCSRSDLSQPFLFLAWMAGSLTIRITRYR